MRVIILYSGKLLFANVVSYRFDDIDQIRVCIISARGLMKKGAAPTQRVVFSYTACKRANAAWLQLLRHYEARAQQEHGYAHRA